MRNSLSINTVTAASKLKSSASSPYLLPCVPSRSSTLSSNITSNTSPAVSTTTANSTRFISLEHTKKPSLILPSSHSRTYSSQTPLSAPNTSSTSSSSSSSSSSQSLPPIEWPSPIKSFFSIFSDPTPQTSFELYKAARNHPLLLHKDALPLIQQQSQLAQYQLTGVDYAKIKQQIPNVPYVIPTARDVQKKAPLPSGNEILACDLPFHDELIMRKAVGLHVWMAHTALMGSITLPTQLIQRFGMKELPPPPKPQEKRRWIEAFRPSVTQAKYVFLTDEQSRRVSAQLFESYWAHDFLPWIKRIKGETLSKKYMSRMMKYMLYTFTKLDKAMYAYKMTNEIEYVALELWRFLYCTLPLDENQEVKMEADVLEEYKLPELVYSDSLMKRDVYRLAQYICVQYVHLAKHYTWVDHKNGKISFLPLEHALQNQIHEVFGFSPQEAQARLISKDFSIWTQAVEEDNKLFLEEERKEAQKNSGLRGLFNRNA